MLQPSDQERAELPETTAQYLIDLEAELGRLEIPQPRATWQESDGEVLWWAFPVSEAPYVGSPLDSIFPRYVTHWTRMPKVVAP